MTGKGGLLLIGLLIAGGVVGTRYLKVNLSPSVPTGLYRLGSVPQTLDRGMLVVLPVPEHVRRIHGSIPLLKPVAGLPGDLVCVQGNQLWVYDTYYGPVYREWHGEALPQPLPLDGCRVVPPATVFLASPVDGSLDSRYFGVVSVGELSALATLLWTW
jgi:conjugal transfer pilin signal peptidase TrbI